MPVRTIRTVFIALLLSVLTTIGFAQSGRLTGQVTDPTGAAIPGATVEVINQDTLVKREATTDASGMFSVAYLPAGKYQIVVNSGSFNPSINHDVAMGVDQSVVFNIQLTIGAASSEVTVQAGNGATEINVQSSEISGTITGSEVATLALNGRNFTQLITLTPGVSNQSQQDEALVGAVGQAKYSFNGGRTEYNSFEVDSSDVLNLSIYPTSAPLIVTPSLDAIQEIKVLTSNYGAQYGRTASGVVVVSTKSGTNSFHGDGYEFLRNEAFNARNYFDPPGSAPLYRRNDFGFTIGGPLYIPHLYNTAKSRTFFFFSEEARIDRTPVSYRVGAPTAKELHGDFSEFCPGGADPADRKLYPNCPLFYDGESGSGNPNYFKANFGDVNMYAILGHGLIPAANAKSGCSSSTGTCYIAAVSPLTHWREELFRIDHDVTARHRLSLRYIHDAWDTVVLSPQWGYLGSQNTYPTVQNTFTGPGINVLASVASSLTQSLLNSLNFSFTDSRIALTDIAGQGSNLRRPAQLDATRCDSSYSQGCPLGYIYDNGFGSKMPGIVFSGTGADLGGGNMLLDTGYMPWEHTSPTYNLTDNATKIWGKHTIQIGAQAIWLQRNQQNSAVGSATGDKQGLITFHNIDPYNSTASILRGQQINSYQQDSGQGRFHQYAFVAEPYLQDDIKATSRLTVNAGLRLSFFGNFYERNRNLYNWVPKQFNYALTQGFYVDPTFGTLIDYSTGQPLPRNTGGLDPRLGNGLVRCGFNHVPASCMTPQLWNPAPRVGFAWDLTGKGTSAVRAGYGMFFEHGTPYESNTGSLEANPPAVLSAEEYYPPSGLSCIGGGNSALRCPSSVLQGAFPLSFTSVPNKTRWAYAQQWNLSYQRQLPRGFVVTLGYVGSKATHLTAERQLNQLQPIPNQLNPFPGGRPLLVNKDCSSNLVNGIQVDVNNLAVACAESTASQGGNLRSPAAVRVVAPGIDKIASIEPVADSNYHAFQFLGRHTQGKLTLDAAYTFSHSIDDSSDRTEIPVDGLDIHANKASSSFDQRQLLEVSYVYQLPVDHWYREVREWFRKDAGHDWKSSSGQPFTMDKVGKILTDKWSLSGLTFFQSGTPFSVYNAGYGKSGISAADNAGVANGLSTLYVSYPDLVGSPHHNLVFAKTGGGDNNKSFGPLLLNPAAFAAPRGLTFGNAGRNVLNNPHRTNFDLSVLKHFTVPHGGDIEFRAEAFNVFNHTQFRIYDPSFGNSPSNTISCYADESAHYSAAGGGGTDCYTGYSFLHPFNAHRARTMQFGLKYVF